jgi:HNH endonuclease
VLKRVEGVSMMWRPYAHWRPAGENTQDPEDLWRSAGESTPDPEGPWRSAAESTQDPDGLVYVRVGESETSYPCTKDQFDQLLERQQKVPITVLGTPDSCLWLFQDKFYWDTDMLAADEVRVHLLARQLRAQREVAHAKAIVAAGTLSQQPARTAISDAVKLFVFQRDGGRCVSCGINVDLQFDHVIPVSAGGASTPENVQILCGSCTRAKDAGLTV